MAKLRAPRSCLQNCGGRQPPPRPVDSHQGHIRATRAGTASSQSMELARMGFHSPPKSRTLHSKRHVRRVQGGAAARTFRKHGINERELRLLAEVGSVLATTLEFEDTLTNIVRRVRVFCADPAKAWVCDALMQIPPGDTQARIARTALETGKSCLIDDVTPKILRSWAGCEEHVAALKCIGPKSAIAAPLLAHGRLLGALSVISSSRRYRAADVRVVEAIAGRAAFFSRMHASIARRDRPPRRGTTFLASSPTTCAIRSRPSARLQPSCAAATAAARMTRSARRSNGRPIE